MSRKKKFGLMLALLAVLSFGGAKAFAADSPKEENSLLARVNFSVNINTFGGCWGPCYYYPYYCYPVAPPCAYPYPCPPPYWVW